MADSVRLPEPGSDHGDWGDLLNAFLSVAHHADGTLRVAEDIGDYIQVRASSGIVPSHALDNVRLEKIVTSRGRSLTWTPAALDVLTVQLPGVYAISVTVNWHDPSVQGSQRYAQISAGDKFRTEEQVRSTAGIETIQSLFLVVTLSEKQGIRVLTQQRSSDTLTPEVTVLVTRMAGISKLG